MAVRRILLLFLHTAALLLACLLHPALTAAQWTPEGVMEMGTFASQTFGTSDYRGHAQNWAIAQDRTGLLYVGNGTGILQYDGVSWRAIPVPGTGAVRSLAAGPEGRIYAGTEGDFGYLAPDSTGSMAYVSLLDALPPDAPDFGFVWRIVATPEAVYFSAREALFRWSAEDGLDVWIPDTLFALGFSHADTFYTVAPGQGLLQMEGDALQPAPAGAALAGDVVYFALPLRDGTSLLGTRDQGLVRYDGSALMPLTTPVDEALAEERLYHGAVLQDGSLAVTTQRGGVYLLTQDGHLLRKIDLASEGATHQVWYAYTDQDGGLWLALNNGLLRLETAASLTYLDADSGLTGMVNALGRHNGALLAASSMGLYRMNTTRGAVPAFEELTDHTAGQCLDLLVHDTATLIGCEYGLYQLKGKQLTRIEERTVRQLYASRHAPGVVYAGTPEGLLRLDERDGEWTATGSVADLPGWVLSMHEDDDGHLWLSTTSDGLYRAHVEGLEAHDITRFGPADGLPPGWAYLAPVEDELLVHTQQGVFTFQPEAPDGPFLRDDRIGPRLKEPGGGVFLFQQDSGGTVWFANERAVGSLQPTAPGRWADAATYLNRFPDVALTGLYTEPERGAVWFGTENGIVRHATSMPAADPPGRRTTHIRSVSTIAGDSLLLGGSAPEDTMVTVPFDQNGLRFAYALPAFDGDGNSFQTFLDGFDEGWSGWTVETVKDYTNLPPDRYTFRVRGRDAHGQEHRIGAVTFTVVPPWYRTWWAYGLFGGLMALLAYGGMRYRVRRLQAHNDVLEAQVAERTRTLYRANERLRRAVAQNNEFLNIAAHELKNPLTSILGFSQIMAEDAVPAKEAQEYLAIIRESAQGMTATIDALQQTDIIEQEQVDLHPTRVNLVAMATTVVRRNEAQARRKNIALHVEADGPVVADVDEQYMPRVLDNLISNAVKFSPPQARVWVRVRQHQDDAVIAVQDEGPGLTDEDLERAFQKLQRLSARPTGGESSTGLGLYIVKNLVALHGGSVDVESDPGAGATFTVRIPAATATPKEGGGTPCRGEGIRRKSQRSGPLP
ncbi:MAG: hypothetical protein GVY15_11380 [Bacteroidetes bacterium]|jgi:signal transduction histidine kinase|nr:hypothetical protein [Bacteroidota bacterium]